MYVDLGEVAPDNKGAVRSTTIEQIIAKANAILHPYTLDVRNVAWHSVYEVGHRLTDRFDDVLPEERGTRTPRVFITGDACHTHSAKAGQGMNVSMQDGFNLGWKLGHVLEGRSPESLLATYSAERQVVAKNLIDFDKVWSTLMAKKPEEFESPSELEDFYVRTAEFPAGFMTQYAPSHAHRRAGAPGPGRGLPDRQALQVRAGGAGLRRQPHAPRPPRHGRRPLAHLRLRGRGRRRRRRRPPRTWPSGSRTRRNRRWPPRRRALTRTRGSTSRSIYQQDHTSVDIGAVPAVFKPHVGPFKLTDYEKVYATDPEADIFELRGLDRDGVVVVVRPDQYVANVLPLTATAELAAFFAPLLPDRKPA